MNFLTIPEPDPLFLLFDALKKFAYLEVLLLLALTRTLVGRGAARWPAFLAFLVCAAGVATVFAPALNMAEGPVYATAARVMNMGQRMSVLMLASSLMLLSAVMPRARWWGIDLLNLLMIVGIWGFWWYVA